MSISPPHHIQSSRIFQLSTSHGTYTSHVARVGAGTPSPSMLSLFLARYSPAPTLFSIIIYLMLRTAFLLPLLCIAQALSLQQGKLFRKALIFLPIASIIINSFPVEALPQGRLEYQPALQGLDYGKPRTYYPDFIQKDSGLQYKVVKEGNGYALLR